MTKTLYRFLRKKELPPFVGLQETQINTLIKSGAFPQPIKLSDSGRAVAWLESEVIEWQRSRMKLRA